MKSLHLILHPLPHVRIKMIVPPIEIRDGKLAAPRKANAKLLNRRCTETIWPLT